MRFLSSLVMLHVFSSLKQLSTVLLWRRNWPLLVLTEQSNTSAVVLQPDIALLSHFWRKSCGCDIMSFFYLFKPLSLTNDLYADLQDKAHHHWELAGWSLQWAIREHDGSAPGKAATQGTFCSSQAIRIFLKKIYLTILLGLCHGNRVAPLLMSTWQICCDATNPVKSLMPFQRLLVQACNRSKLFRCHSKLKLISWSLLCVGVGVEQPFLVS